jgi:hypothetical protein
MSALLKKVAEDQKAKKQLDADAKGRLDRIKAGGNPVQRRFWSDKSKYKSLRCPRRSGKSFSMTGEALICGEEEPFRRILIISLTLKSTKENFWNGPGGIKYQNNAYQLGLTYNETECVWYHQNGSRGRLAGAETKADIEYLRGAAAEADVVLIDECKSFPPELLRQLIRDVVEPGLMTRDGTLIMGGTPGNLPVGEFYKATQLGVKINAEDPNSGHTCYLFTGENRTDDIWSLHTWTVADNEAKPAQWERALRIKKKDKVDDSDPRWRREFLGEWVTDTTELVYAYSKMKITGKVTWTPEFPRKNKTGLPEILGPWRIVMGLDFGYEDMNAIVVAAYSDTVKELRHVYDFKKNHMTIDEFGYEISYTIDRFGLPEAIIGDKGSLGGVLYIQELNSRFGLSIIEAEKREKYDHIELLNSDFYSGRIKIIESEDINGLEFELCALQWDLSKDDKKRLIRVGKLREDPSCMNHLCDAFLYLWRYCNHYWATPAEIQIDKTTEEWYIQNEKENIERYRRKLSGEDEYSEYEALRESDNVVTRDNIEMWSFL